LPLYVAVTLSVPELKPYCVDTAGENVAVQLVVEQEFRFTAFSVEPMVKYTTPLSVPEVVELTVAVKVTAPACA
jgi:hypothetical protein